MTSLLLFEATSWLNVEMLSFEYIQRRERERELIPVTSRNITTSEQ